MEHALSNNLPMKCARDLSINADLGRHFGPPSAALPALPALDALAQGGALAQTRPSAAHRRSFLVRSSLACVGLVTAALKPGASHAQARPEAAPSFYDGFVGMRLLDQAGQPLQLNSLRGKVVLFNFMFTACATTCPVQTHALAQLQRQLTPAVRARMHLVSVSLDALSDTPQTMKAFAAKFQVNHANWSFVTGRPEDIYRLAEALWLFRDGKGKAPLDAHNTSLWLVDAQGVLRARFAGSQPDIGRLDREITALASRA